LGCSNEEVWIKKIPVAIIGPGRIGCDLLVKVMKSKYLECIMFAGQRNDSPGLAFAKSLDIPTSTKSIEAILLSKAPIVFDATTAEAHKQNIQALHNCFVIDLTPAKQLPICVPNVTKASTKGVSLGSCTIQAVIPKLTKIKNLEYVEVVTTIASDSAGMGTRENLSEYLITTAKIIEQFTGAKAKAILIINPVLQAMHNTIYFKRKNSDKIEIIQFELEGGDYLDKRFGNLSIMTQSALAVAEEYAKNSNSRFNP
jgi:acetaldehyde dehydrogenase